MYAAAKVELSRCTGCKLCILACPDPNVICFLADDKKVKIDVTRCKGCGLCVAACPKAALVLEALTEAEPART
ncbi:MAG TPA: 4Fe-4S binding protein [Bacillota bacterium]|nr:4Fe-4S binding protein [Bacillota bacterium]